MYTDQDIANLVARVQQLEQQIAFRSTQDVPKLGITSKNFLTRAFSVWGHYFVASLLIGIAVSCITVIITLILGASIADVFGDIANNLPQF